MFRLLSLVVTLSVFGCKIPLFKRVDVPGFGTTGEQAAFVGFDLSGAGSPKSIWASKGNPNVPAEFSFQRYDGSAWVTVTVPPVFLENATVPSPELEAMSDGNALVLSTRKNGGPVAGLITPDGTFTDLTASLPGTSMTLRPGASLWKRAGVVYAKLDEKVFKYEGGTFTRLSPADETAWTAATVENDDLWVKAGDTNWRLLSGTFYHVFPDDESRVAKLEVLRSVNGGAPQRTLLKAEPDDLMGAGGYITGSLIITDSYGVMGLVRGADDSMWVSIVHVNDELNELIFRKVVGDTISKEERFGIDLATCSTTIIQPECLNPRFLGGQWPKGSPIILGSGLQAGSTISALLVQTGELR